jgi:hypothetical protein
MHYGETKKVRAVQGDQFVKDFKKVRTIVVWAANTGRSFPALKLDVWERAKTEKIYYFMTDDVFQNRRVVMKII